MCVGTLDGLFAYAYAERSGPVCVLDREIGERKADIPNIRAEESV